MTAISETKLERRSEVARAQEARLAQYPREGLLDEILSLLTRPAQGPGRAIEPIDVVPEPLRVKLSPAGHALGPSI